MYYDAVLGCKIWFWQSTRTIAIFEVLCYYTLYIYIYIFFSLFLWELSPGPFIMHSMLYISCLPKTIIKNLSLHHLFSFWTRGAERKPESRLTRRMQPPSQHQVGSFCFFKNIARKSIFPIKLSKLIRVWSLY